MAMVRCTECANEISSYAHICPHCGAKRRKGVSRLVIVGIGILGAFLLLAAIGASNPNRDAKAHKRDAINLCWSEYERKSLGPSEKLFVAGACERMENEFREKFGVNP